MAPSPDVNSVSVRNIKNEKCHLNILCQINSEMPVNRIDSKDKENPRNLAGKKSFVSRKEEAAAIRNKFPTKIPIIVQRFHKETSLPCLDKSKFLVPQEITMSQFVTIIRNRMKLGSNQAFYMLVNNRSMLSMSKTLIEVYSEHKEADGFLYVTYASQEVFG